jgi:hypothetical protein
MQSDIIPLDVISSLIEQMRDDKSSLPDVFNAAKYIS